MGIITVLWERWLEFKRDFLKITLAALIAPLMYIIVFGLGIRTSMNGEPYLKFLVPGVICITTMNASFNAIAQNLNVQRLYEKAFDQVIISPTPLWQFVVGQVLAGALRGIYAGIVILMITIPFKLDLVFNIASFMILFMNSAVFSALGVLVSFVAKKHQDVPRFSNYIIMPMAYLCNTFFGADRIPGIFGKVVLLLPLSQTSEMVRNIAKKNYANYTGALILLFYIVFLFIGILYFLYKKENM